MLKVDMTKKPTSSEADFLASYDPSAFERPSVTVDVVLLTVQRGALQVLLVKRKEPPFQGYWSLPGGFVGMQESLEQAAERALWDKLNLSGVFIEQLYTFGSPKRDSRMRIISVAYYALVSAEQLKAAELPQQIALAEVRQDGVRVGRKTVKLAFDHAEIVQTALKRLRGKVGYSPVGFELLPEQFTLRQLQEIHQAILGYKLNKDSFRRKMLASGGLEASGLKEAGMGFRPAELYRRKEGTWVW